MSGNKPPLVEYTEQGHMHFILYKGCIVQHTEMWEEVEIEGKRHLKQVAAIVLRTDSGEIRLLPLQKQHRTIRVKEVRLA